MNHLNRRIARHLLAWALVALALALVFSWYLNPHFAVDMAGRFWSCI
jgi:hypothetical protein